MGGIEKIHEIATHGLAEARAYLSELRLMGPEPSRFREAMEKCCAEAAAKAGFKVDLAVKSIEETLEPNVALASFQIVRELLNNAAAHSGAANVEVRIQVEDAKLLIEVEDDGKGFDVAQVRAEKTSQGHLGLVGVEERARQLNGTFTLASQPGKGARATACLPV